MRKRLCILLLAGLGMIVAPALVSAQDNSVSGLQRRVQRMEQDLSVLQRDYFRGDRPAAAGPSSAVPLGAANIEIRMTALEGEIRALTGTIEQLGHRISLLEQSSEKMAADVEFRLNELEGRSKPVDGVTTTITPDAAAAARGANAPTASPPGLANQGLSVDERYNNARRMIAQGRYEGAEAELMGLLAAFPDAELAPNAQYWLGETYYVRERYEDAATIFVTGLQQYGGSGKGPDYMLKLGMSLIGMGNKDDGCAALTALPERYTDAPASINERALSMRQRFQCP